MQRDKMFRKLIIKFGVLALIANTLISPALANDAYMPELIPTPQDSVMFMMVEPSNTQNFNYLITKKDAELQSNNSINWIYCNSLKIQSVTLMINHNLLLPILFFHFV